MDNLLSGLIGAICGSVIAGIFSFWGAVRSTKTAIKAQKELMKEESNRIQDESANRKNRYINLIQSEMVIWIEYSVRRANKVVQRIEKRGPNIDFNNHYRIYLDAFIDKLTLEESKLIIELYGLIKKVNINLENKSYVNGNNLEITHSLELLVLKVFDKEFLEEYRNIDPTLITRDSILHRMNKDYKLLLEKLDKLSSKMIICG